MNWLNVERLFSLLAGIWAFGLGFRLSLELILHDAFLVYGILWFDWVPLMVFGGVTVCFNSYKTWRAWFCD